VLPLVASSALALAFVSRQHATYTHVYLPNCPAPSPGVRHRLILGSVVEEPSRRWYAMLHARDHDPANMCLGQAKVYSLFWLANSAFQQYSATEAAADSCTASVNLETWDSLPYTPLLIPLKRGAYSHQCKGLSS
jgi:hypothetical protein